MQRRNQSPSGVTRLKSIWNLYNWVRKFLPDHSIIPACNAHTTFAYTQVPMCIFLDSKRSIATISMTQSINWCLLFPADGAISRAEDHPAVPLTDVIWLSQSVNAGECQNFPAVNIYLTKDQVPILLWSPSMGSRYVVKVHDATQSTLSSTHRFISTGVDKKSGTLI